MPEENSLTPAEAKALHLRQKGLSAEQTSRRLTAQGIPVTPQQITSLPQKIEVRNKFQLKKIEAADSLLNSIKRVTKEWEELYKDVNLAKNYFKEKKDYSRMLGFVQQAVNMLTISLKKLGELNEDNLKLQAKNINIFSTTDISEAFKKMQHAWFDQMDAQYTNGQLVFTKPSPEIIDDFNKWQAKQFRESVRVNAEESEKEVK